MITAAAKPSQQNLGRMEVFTFTAIDRMREITNDGLIAHTGAKGSRNAVECHHDRGSVQQRREALKFSGFWRHDLENRDGNQCGKNGLDLRH